MNITDSMMEGMKEASKLNQQRLTEEGVDNELGVKETHKSHKDCFLMAVNVCCLKNAITSVNIANAMIASAQEKMKQLEEQMLTINAERKNIRKRRQALLSNCQTELKKKVQ